MGKACQGELVFFLARARKEYLAKGLVSSSYLFLLPQLCTTSESEHKPEFSTVIAAEEMHKSVSTFELLPTRTLFGEKSIG